jgi:hypothetical protein
MTWLQRNLNDTCTSESESAKPVEHLSRNVKGFPPSFAPTALFGAAVVADGFS